MDLDEEDQKNYHKFTERHQLRNNTDMNPHYQMNHHAYQSKNINKAQNESSKDLINPEVDVKQTQDEIKKAVKFNKKSLNYFIRKISLTILYYF